MTVREKQNKKTPTPEQHQHLNKSQNSLKTNWWQQTKQ